MWKLVVLAALVVPGVARADNQIWNAAAMQARPGPTGITGWLDLHARRRADSTLAIIRPGIGYTISKLVAVHAGYAYVPTITDAGDNRKEQRIWQQAIISYAPAASTKLQGRARLEQRFGSGDDLGHRIRLMARAQWQPSPELGLQLVGWDELFWGLNDVDWGPVSGYDQNRLFLGVGTDTVLRGVRVEAGYLNVHLRGGAPIVHAVAVNLFAVLTP